MIKSKNKNLISLILSIILVGILIFTIVYYFIQEKQKEEKQKEEYQDILTTWVETVFGPFTNSLIKPFFGREKKFPRKSDYTYDTSKPQDLKKVQSNIVKDGKYKYYKVTCPHGYKLTPRYKPQFLYGNNSYTANPEIKTINQCGPDSAISKIRTDIYDFGNAWNNIFVPENMQKCCNRHDVCFWGYDENDKITGYQKKCEDDFQKCTDNIVSLGFTKSFPVITRNFGYTSPSGDNSLTCVRDTNIPLKKNKGIFQTIKTCPTGEYLSGDGCKKCPQENAIFTGLDCEFTCKDGYSKDGYGRNCKKCDNISNGIRTGNECSETRCYSGYKTYINTCIPCKNLPKNATFIDTGKAEPIKSQCQWKCNQGYQRVDEISLNVELKNCTQQLFTKIETQPNVTVWEGNAKGDAKRYLNEYDGKFYTSKEKYKYWLTGGWDNIISPEETKKMSLKSYCQKIVDKK